MKNDYEVRGDITAIFLKRKDGSILEAIISTSDLEQVKTFPNSWNACYDPTIDNFYVRGHSKYIEGKRYTIHLHRYIFNNPNGYQIDHINHNTLDNTRANLNIVSQYENKQNRSGLDKNNSSGFRGVYWCRTKKKWVGKIVSYGKTKRKYFEHKEDAAIWVEEFRKIEMPYLKVKENES
jgi:hypothetical protein